VRLPADSTVIFIVRASNKMYKWFYLVVFRDRRGIGEGVCSCRVADVKMGVECTAETSVSTQKISSFSQNDSV
jgi:hypothetical protein